MDWYKCYTDFHNSQMAGLSAITFLGLQRFSKNTNLDINYHDKGRGFKASKHLGEPDQIMHSNDSL